MVVRWLWVVVTIWERDYIAFTIDDLQANYSALVKFLSMHARRVNEESRVSYDRLQALGHGLLC